MSLSLFDHHRRLKDLEMALGALLDLLPRAGVDADAVAEAARRLRVRGQDGAAALLTGSARSYAP